MDESLEISAEYFKRSANHQLKYFEKLISRTPFKDSDHVFELGCGTGAMSAHIAKEIVPNGKVTACDPEKNRIRIAKDKFSDIPSLQFIHATGSVALEDKKDLYDVILSNAVLHWIKEDELEVTLAKMFTALKNGGISSHNFIEDMPNTYKTLRKINENKVNGMLHIFHPIQEEKFAELARKAGFLVVDSQKYLHVTEVDTEKDLLKLADASTYGLFEWEKAYNDAKDNGLLVEFDVTETGKLAHKSELIHVILKKP